MHLRFAKTHQADVLSSHLVQMENRPAKISIGLMCAADVESTNERLIVNVIQYHTTDRTAPSMHIVALYTGNAIHHEALKSFAALTIKSTDPVHVPSSQVIAG